MTSKKIYIFLILTLLSAQISFAQERDRPLIERLPFGSQLPFPNNPNFNLYADHLADAGVQWVRFDLCWWSLAEYYQGTFNFQIENIPEVQGFQFPWNTDDAVAAVKSCGMEPIVILAYSNFNYDNDQVTGDRDAAWIEAFARYCFEAASRYKDDVDYYEIWNEPNLEFFWGETVDPELYRRMTIRAAERVREADPDAFIIGGAVSGIDNGFLNSAFSTEFFEAVDAITVHPYRIAAPETIGSEINDTRTFIANNTTRDIPVWTGEWGYNTYWTEIDAIGQAKALQRMFTNNLRIGIDLSIWFSAHPFCELAGQFGDCASMNPEWGLVGYDNQPRPSLEAFEVINSVYNLPMQVVDAPFQLNVSPNPLNMERLFIQNGDGSYTVALWRATWPIIEGTDERNVTLSISSTENDLVINEVIDGLTGNEININPLTINNITSVSNFPIPDYPVFLNITETSFDIMVDDNFVIY